MIKLPPVLRAYMSAHGIDASSVLPDGRIALQFDSRWRVQVRPLNDGRLLLSAALLDVSRLSTAQLDELLLPLASYSLGVIRDHASALALDVASGRLMLQQQVSAEVNLAQFESAVGDFVNLLSFWSGSTRMEAARQQVALGR